MKRQSSIQGIRRAWAVVLPQERWRLRRVAIYGVLIAGLDTFALLLVYALINILNNQGATGITGTLVRDLHLDGADRYRVALTLLAITAALFVVRSLLSILVLWLGVGAANAAQADLISRLLIGHARAPQLMRLSRNSSETLRTVLSSVDQVTSGVVAGSVSLIANLAVALAVALGLLLSNPIVAIAVTLYFAVISVAWVRVVRGGLTRRGRQIQELQEERYRFIIQGLSAAKELQLRGRALFYADGAIAKTRGMNKAARGASVANGSLRYLLETSLVVGSVLVVAVAGLADGRSTALPAVGLVLAGAFRFLPALNQILFLSNQVQFNSSAIDFVEEELRTFGAYGHELWDGTRPATVPPLRLEREVRLKGVSFQYPTRSEPALRGISFAVRPGEAIGIVGPTGSGKSTLLDIILGLLQPVDGEVTIDGVPLVERREAWQRSIGYVPQDVYLVDDTLRANVALGWQGSEIDDAAALEAVQMAGLADVISALPDGIETVVGERGVRLSGGQRQRVGLARALYTRPSVLVLDEATSNLDHGTERRIVDTLAALPGGATMIVVTHRTVSVRRCDRILYLERGAIRAEGTFEEISASVPEFDDVPQPVVAVPG